MKIDGREPRTSETQLRSGGVVPEGEGPLRQGEAESWAWLGSIARAHHGTIEAAKQQLGVSRLGRLAYYAFTAPADSHPVGLYCGTVRGIDLFLTTAPRTGEPVIMQRQICGKGDSSARLSKLPFGFTFTAEERQLLTQNLERARAVQELDAPLAVWQESAHVPPYQEPFLIRMRVL